MKILGFVPARSGSKGIPKKNIYPLDGKPLITYTLEESLKSRINRLIVSTDSQEIAEISKKFGAEVPFLRPDELAGDDSTVEEAIGYTLDRFKKEEGYEPDIIVLLQPTSPLRKVKHIDESIAILLKNNADSVVSVSNPMEHPADMVFWDKNGAMHFLMEKIITLGKTQRQNYPKCYFLNGAVYTFTYKNFVENESRFGEKTIPYMMPQVASIDIDSMDNLYIAESLIMRKTIETKALFMGGKSE